MTFAVADSVVLVRLFEARLVGERGEVLAIVHGSTDFVARGLARETNVHYDLGASRIELRPVDRFRAAVVDDHAQPMYLAYGVTPDDARARAAAWLQGDPPVLLH